jgi:hypothetical protein
MGNPGSHEVPIIPMKTIRHPSFFTLLATSLTLSLPLVSHATTLADAGANYSTSGQTIGSTMVPLTDSFGTGTWTYDAVTVNSTTDPTGVSGPSLLTYAYNANVSPYNTTEFGTPSDGNELPAVSNTALFGDNSSIPSGYLDMHPNGGSTAVMLQWTAGAGETGNLSLTFDLTRVGVGSPAAPTGNDNFTVFQNGNSIYSDLNVAAGTSGTGSQTLTLSGVTMGTTVDFVLSASNGNLGFNAAYLSAQIDSVPEPSTYAMMLGGMALLGFCVRRKAGLVG